MCRWSSERENVQTGGANLAPGRNQCFPDANTSGFLALAKWKLEKRMDALPQMNVEPEQSSFRCLQPSTLSQAALSLYQGFVNVISRSRKAWQTGWLTFLLISPVYIGQAPGKLRLSIIAQLISYSLSYYRLVRTMARAARGLT